MTRREITCHHCGGFLGYALVTPDTQPLPPMYDGPCWERETAASYDVDDRDRDEAERRHAALIELGQKLKG